MKRYEIETNDKHTAEKWADFCYVGFVEVDAPGDGSITIDVNDEQVNEVEQYLDRADWCESYSELSE